MTTRSSSARLRSQHIGEKGSRRTLTRTKDFVSKVPFRHFLFGQAPLRDPTAFRGRSPGQPRPQNAQPPTPPPSALLLMPQPLGKRTNHALSSGIPTLHLPPENYSTTTLRLHRSSLVRAVRASLCLLTCSPLFRSSSHFASSPQISTIGFLK